MLVNGRQRLGAHPPSQRLTLAPIERPAGVGLVGEECAEHRIQDRAVGLIADPGPQQTQQMRVPLQERLGLREAGLQVLAFESDSAARQREDERKGHGRLRRRVVIPTTLRNRCIQDSRRGRQRLLWPGGLCPRNARCPASR